jgi:hypothetical protein
MILSRGTYFIASPITAATGEVDAVDELDKAVHEVLPSLLAVGHGVDAAILLQLRGEQGGVEMGLAELVAGEPPGRPQAVRLREPGRLRQAHQFA